MARLGDIENRGGKCASQMAFYRLRRAAGLDNAKVRPDLPLEALGLGNPKRTMQALARCGLKIPGAGFGVLGSLMIPVAMLAGIALIVGAIKVVSAMTSWSAVIFGISTALMIVAPRAYPRGIATLGDLATRVTALNLMMLKAQGAGLRKGDIWQSLRSMAAEESGMAADEIRPDTPFVQQKANQEKVA